MQQTQHVRRAPKFSAFMMTGAILGLIIGVFFAVLSPQDTNYSFVSSLAFFGMSAAIVGCGLGAMVAVLFDKKSLKTKDI